MRVDLKSLSANIYGKKEKGPKGKEGKEGEKGKEKTPIVFLSNDPSSRRDRFFRAYFQSRKRLF
ncbi:MAG: hypothetical protein Q7S50_03955 [bacterium]|nr:hypothetical protein [bacterium]